MDRSPQNSGPAGQGSGEPPKRGSNDAGPDYSSLAGMGFQFVIAILLFLFIGKWLDSRLGTSPWLLILGVFSGAAASMVSMYRKVFPPEQSKGEDRSRKPPQ